MNEQQLEDHIIEDFEAIETNQATRAQYIPNDIWDTFDKLSSLVKPLSPPTEVKPEFKDKLTSLRATLYFAHYNLSLNYKIHITEIKVITLMEILRSMDGIIADENHESSLRQAMKANNIGWKEIAFFASAFTSALENNENVYRCVNELFLKPIDFSLALGDKDAWDSVSPNIAKLPLTLIHPYKEVTRSFAQLTAILEDENPHLFTTDMPLGNFCSSLIDPDFEEEYQRMDLIVFLSYALNIVYDIDFKHISQGATWLTDKLVKMAWEKSAANIEAMKESDLINPGITSMLEHQLIMAVTNTEPKKALIQTYGKYSPELLNDTELCVYFINEHNSLTDALSAGIPDDNDGKKTAEVEKNIADLKVRLANIRTPLTSV